GVDAGPQVPFGHLGNLAGGNAQERSVHLTQLGHLRHHGNVGWKLPPLGRIPADHPGQDHVGGFEDSLDRRLAHPAVPNHHNATGAHRGFPPSYQPTAAAFPVRGLHPSAAVRLAAPDTIGYDTSQESRPVGRAPPHLTAREAEVFAHEEDRPALTADRNAAPGSRVPVLAWRCILGRSCACLRASLLQLGRFPSYQATGARPWLCFFSARRGTARPWRRRQIAWWSCTSMNSLSGTVANRASKGPASTWRLGNGWGWWAPTGAGSPSSWRSWPDGPHRTEARSGGSRPASRSGMCLRRRRGSLRFPWGSNWARS